MKKRVLGVASVKFLSIRCTEQEYEFWQRLAEKRGKPLYAMVRDSLNRQVVAECLCVPGKNMCLKCQAALVAATNLF